MRKISFSTRVSGRRGHRERIALAKSINSARMHDFGLGEMPYNLNRRLCEAPFASSLKDALLSRLDFFKGKVRVLDKGAGSGMMLSDVKKLAPKRVEATALSLSKSIDSSQRLFLDRVMIGAGINARHKQKFDLIYDCYGEDYHISKGLKGKSIAKSLRCLKEGGVLFTIIPLLYRPHELAFTVEEGHAFLKGLKKRFPKARFSSEEIPKRFDRYEYIDLVLEIRKP